MPEEISDFLPVAEGWWVAEVPDDELWFGPHPTEAAAMADVVSRWGLGVIAKGYRAMIRLSDAFDEQAVLNAFEVWTDNEDLLEEGGGVDSMFAERWSPDLMERIAAAIREAVNGFQLKEALTPQTWRITFTSKPEWVGEETTNG